MKSKSLGYTESPHRGPGSSGVRTFQPPVLCHHFSAPDLRAVRRVRKTHTCALESPLMQETPPATPGASPCTAPGTTGGERDGRGWQQPGTGRSDAGLRAGAQHPLKGRCEVEPFKQAMKGRRGRKTSLPERLFLTRSIPLPPPPRPVLNCCSGTPWAEFPAVQMEMVWRLGQANRWKSACS